MIASLVRTSALLARQPVVRSTQIWKRFASESPNPKDFLSKSVGGDPFYGVPFSYRNHIRFSIVFILYFAIPFWAPPIVIHLQLWKRSFA